MPRKSCARPAERFLYALTCFSVEKREGGWYLAPTAVRHTKEDWQGPYKSEASVISAVAGQLRRELAERYRRQLRGRAA